MWWISILNKLFKFEYILLRDINSYNICHARKLGINDYWYTRYIDNIVLIFPAGKLSSGMRYIKSWKPITQGMKEYYYSKE